MRVKMLRDMTVVVDKMTSRTWPAGWAGEVDDDIAGGWKTGVDYQPLPPPEAPIALTRAQTQVLAAAADQALAAQAAEEARAAYEAMALAELRAIAVARGLDGASRMKKADLVVALSR